MADFSIDWSPLARLPDVYREGQMRQRRQMALSDLGRGASATDVATRLFQAGDVQGGLSLANLANTIENQKFNRGIAERQIALQERVANRRDEPEDIRKLRAAGMDPATPEGRKALFPRTDTPVSATDKRAIFEAEDAVPQLQGTIEALNRAKELNDKTFTGYTAGIRGAIGTKVPGGGALVDRNAALATEEWSKIMGPEALQTMAGTLKGATTDFELRKFIEMLADPSTDPRVRASVIDRMSKLAERKLQIQQSRVKDLRGGTYFKPQGAAPSGPSRPMSQEEYNALPSGATYTAPDGSTRTKR